MYIYIYSIGYKNNGVYAAKDVSPGGTSVPQRQKIPCWWCKILSRNWSGALIGRHTCSSYTCCLQMPNKRQKATNFKCTSKWGRKHNEFTAKQSVFVEYIIMYSSLEKAFCWSLIFVCSRTQHFTVMDQDKHKIKQMYIWNPLDYRILLCKHWFTSSVWNFCHWGADVPPGETSLAGRSKEKGLYLAANNAVKNLLKLYIFVWLTSLPHVERIKKVHYNNCSYYFFRFKKDKASFGNNWRNCSIWTSN